MTSGAIRSTINAGIDAALAEIAEKLALLEIEAAELLGVDVLRWRACRKDVEKLQHEIGELERQRAQNVRQTELDKLAHALLSLDYTRQIRTFREAASQNQAIRSAVVIAPSSSTTSQVYYASRLLLKRLIDVLPEGPAVSPIQISLGRRSRRGDTAAIWRELARSVDVKASSDAAAIATEVAHRLKSQHVVIILRDLDRIDYRDCLGAVWLKLEGEARLVESSYLLLFFLIDESGIVNLATFRAAIARQRFGTCLVLPTIASFSHTELQRWFESSIDYVPISLAMRSGKELSAEVHAGSDRGKPDRVLQLLFELWSLSDWELESWLTA